ncbi:hypothetical protein QFC22_006509 [Naganishia vaughanmartiniae]|uniref:Uncharacterized protein n=1 Tax=Naganishia vaughanmartiniae TaxID=1424756 RepID=A0ACC2WLQ2_9TREE|nr:hypothetical protein QFC22_006509 [Naganishia vaughanmartiniae]
MSQSNYSPFSPSQNGLRRRLAVKNEGQATDNGRIRIDTAFLNNAEARATKSAITPSHYQRAALIALAQSPLASTCIDARRFARFSALLSAEHSPSAAQIGGDIKGSPIPSEATYPPHKAGGSYPRESPSTAVTTARWANSYKTSSHSAVQFNRDNYAVMYATPFTPDWSLMKPVDLSAWSPCMSTPLVTPYDQKSHGPRSNLESNLGSPSGTSGKEAQMNGGGFNPALKPSAKVFIPSSTPTLMGNPQPKRMLGTESLPARHCMPSAAVGIQKSEATRTHLSANSPSHSFAMGAQYTVFEVPKALTPLARPSAALPARPVECAVAPNLPRWAHSPGHAMLASLESTNKQANGSMMRSSMMRRATVSLADGQSLPAIPVVSQSLVTKLVILAAQDTDDSGEDEEPLTSCVRSTSMTPWAIQKTRELSNSLLGESEAAEENALILDIATQTDCPMTAKTSTGRMKSPESMASNLIAVQTPSSAVKAQPAFPLLASYLPFAISCLGTRSGIRKIEIVQDVPKFLCISS